jgi:hypothetical protein
VKSSPSGNRDFTSMRRTKPAINNSHSVRQRTDGPIADEHSQTRISDTATYGSSFAVFCALRGFRLFPRGTKGNVSETHIALLLSALGWRRPC